MTCQFCGQQLAGTQTKTCAKKACLLAAKRARAKIRREAGATPRKRQRTDDGRTWDFPPELEYLDQDPGITIEQMINAQCDPRLHRLIIARRSARLTRLRERLRR